jgi:hypothetical protein
MKWSNVTHRSTAHPAALLAKKGKGYKARLSYRGHVLVENYHRLVVDAELTPATGTAERGAALAIVTTIPSRRRFTLGADKGYDTQDFVARCHRLGITPHVAQNTTHRSRAWRRESARRLYYICASVATRSRTQHVQLP